MAKKKAKSPAKARTTANASGPAKSRTPAKASARTPAREKLTTVRPSGNYVRKTGPRKKIARLPDTSNVGPSANEPKVRSDDNFFELVHEVARQIPKGRVTSYGAIGRALGTRSSARMVGWAMNACHLATKPVPAHRVVNSIGLLTGRHHFNPPEKMQQLLEKEGVVVKNNKVVDFSKLFWDPATEL